MTIGRKVRKSDRQITDRQTHRHTDLQTDSWTCGLTDRHTKRQLYFDDKGAAEVFVFAEKNFLM